MSQYIRLCPSCGRENADSATFCDKCNADLTAVRLRKPVSQSEKGDTPIPKTSINTPPLETNARGEKICPKCGAKNANGLILCSCGADITSVTADSGTSQNKSMPSSPIADSPKIIKKAIISPDAKKNAGDKRLMILAGEHQSECKDGDVLGRHGSVACQLFSGIRTVSSRHVSVQLRDGQWWLTNLPLQSGRTEKNATIVDGCELPIGDSVALSGDHTLQMSSSCTVKLKVV